MPTIIVLDVSLSMCRLVKGDTELRQLAAAGIGTLIDYFAQKAKLEQTAFVVYSNFWEVKQNFTRNHEAVKNILYDLEIYDRSNLLGAFDGLLSLKLSDFAYNDPVNIILITDGLVSSTCSGSKYCDVSDSEDSNDGYWDSDGTNEIFLKQISEMFKFESKIQIVCLTSNSDPCLKYSLPFYKELISGVDTKVKEPSIHVGHTVKKFTQSAIWILGPTPVDLTVEASEKLFNLIATTHYKPHNVMLKFGHLSSLVTITPPLNDFELKPLKNNFDIINSTNITTKSKCETYVTTINDRKTYKPSDEIEICGFLPITTVASPAVVSKHLVYASSETEETAKHELLSEFYAHSKVSRDTNSKSSVIPTKKLKLSTLNASNSKRAPEQEPMTKVPSFYFLLDSNLSRESLVALCIVGKNEDNDDEWFGMLHHQQDSKKRSYMTLSIFRPGPNPIPWLFNIKSMIAKSLLPPDDVPNGNQESLKTNPLKSYSSNTKIWLDAESVQVDIQKILRQARRLPDRAATFLKELNKVRRAAISYGFFDILYTLATMLEREKDIAFSSDPTKNIVFLQNADIIINKLRADLNETSYAVSIALDSIVSSVSLS